MNNLEMTDIHCLAAVYSKKNKALGTLIEQVQAAQNRILNNELAKMEMLLHETAACRIDLYKAVEANPGLFEKPKSTTAYDVKFGFRKAAGKLELPSDEDLLINRINKFHPELVEILLKTSVTPVKTALANLSGKQLKALGVTLQDATDVVTISFTKGDVEKVASNLLKSKEQQEKAA